MMDSINEIIIALIGAVAPIVTTALNLFKKSGLSGKNKVANLGEVASILEVVTKDTEIGKQLAILKNCLNHRGIVEQNEEKYDKYIWNQIEIIKSCAKHSEQLRQVQCLVDFIHLAIYDEKERLEEDKKKKVLIIAAIIGEIIALCIIFFEYKTIDIEQKNNYITLMLLFYIFLPFLLGIMASHLLGKNRWCKAFFSIIIVIIIAAMLFLIIVYYDFAVNAFGSFAFGIIMCSTMYIFDFSKYRKLEEEVKNKIKDIRNKYTKE